MDYNDWIICNECKKLLPISCFYTHWGHSTTAKDKNKKYLKVHKTCKKCWSRLRLERVHGIKLQIEEEKIENEIQEYQPAQTEAWIIRNLKRFGNCYIRDLRKVNIKTAVEELGFNIRIIALQSMNGYILEKKKGE